MPAVIKNNTIPEKLVARVLKALQEIGIENAEFIEFDKNKIYAWFTDGVIRESKYKSIQLRQDETKDIGYFTKNLYGNYVFNINGFVFSYKKNKELVELLNPRGVIVQQYVPFGPIFRSEKEIKKWNERTPLYA